MIVPTFLSIFILTGVVVSLYGLLHFYRTAFKDLEEMEKKLY